MPDKRVIWGSLFQNLVGNCIDDAGGRAMNVEIRHRNTGTDFSYNIRCSNPPQVFFFPRERFSLMKRLAQSDTMMEDHFHGHDSRRE